MSAEEIKSFGEDYIRSPLDKQEASQAQTQKQNAQVSLKQIIDDASNDDENDGMHSPKITFVGEDDDDDDSDEDEQ